MICGDYGKYVKISQWAPEEYVKVFCNRTSTMLLLAAVLVENN